VSGGRGSRLLARVLRGVRARLPGRAPYAQLASLVSAFDRDERAAEILCLGDSVLERVSHHDEDQRTLGRILADMMSSGPRLLPISGSGYHVEVFSALLRAVATMKHRPDIVVVPVNLRSFSPQWDLNPSYAFADELRALDAFVREPQRRVPSIPTMPRPSAIATRKWHETPVAYPSSTLHTVAEFQAVVANSGNTDPERLRQIFVYHYMHPLGPTHRKLAMWDALFRAVVEMRVRCIAYATPVNVDGGSEFAGAALAESVRASVKRFEHATSANARTGLTFLDLSELLDADDFFRRHEATEHLNANGRKKLAARLTDAIGAARAPWPPPAR
jgi:hypothetical protein